MSEENTAGETDDTPGVGEVEAALREARREIRKAALVHSSVDAALAGAAVGFAGTVLGLDARVGIELEPVSVTTVAALAATGLAFLLGMAYWVRGTPEERFEAANTGLTPALRTARDIVDDGRSDVMARRLYADVIDRLRTASSADLIRERRVAIAIVLATLLSLGTLQAAVAGVELTPDESTDVAGGGPGANPEREPPTNTTLRSGDEVLGTPSDPSVGDEELRANVSTSGGGGEEEPDDRNYEASGLSSDTTIETSRAGFSSRDDVENADIIRDYNLKIRENDDD